MIHAMRQGIPHLFKEGTKYMSSVVVRNCMAARELAKLTGSSYGPLARKKLIVNHLGKVSVSSDAAKILDELEIQHPVGRLIRAAAAMQEREVGDGSNYVVMLAGALMNQAEHLIQTGLHPSEIVSGYEVAAKEALRLVEELSVMKVEPADMTDRKLVARAIRSCISSKQYGLEDLLSGLVAEACVAVMPERPSNFVVDHVRTVKLQGGDVSQSEVVRGMVVNTRPLGTVMRVKDAKIAVFSCAVDNATTETSSQVLIQSADELVDYNEGEEKAIEAVIRRIAEDGVNLIVTGGSVGDMALHFCNKFGIMVIRIMSKFELRRITRTVKARVAVALGPQHPDCLGHCASVRVREMGTSRVIVFEQEAKDSLNVATILLRASTNNTLNDIERAIDDGVNVVRQMARDGRFLAGAGAGDIELARRLKKVAEEREGLEQYAIDAFASALEVVPRTLAENAGQKDMDVISQLYAAHEKGGATTGVDITSVSSIARGKSADEEKGGNGGTRFVRDVTDGENPVYDHLVAKRQAMKLSANAVITVLRVDQIIMSKPAGGPKMPKKGGHWDDED